MNKIIGKINALILSALMIVSGTAAVTGVFNTNRLTAVAADDTIILRVCNWEEYIDTGDWSDDDIIDLESGSIKETYPMNAAGADKIRRFFRIDA